MSFSNRCFQTKAVAMWLQADDIGRLTIVGSYFHYSAEWDQIIAYDIKKAPVDTPKVRGLAPPPQPNTHRPRIEPSQSPIHPNSYTHPQTQTHSAAPTAAAFHGRDHGEPGGGPRLGKYRLGSGEDELRRPHVRGQGSKIASKMFSARTFSRRLR